jgi:large subunit ribosomal protein L10
VKQNVLDAKVAVVEEITGKLQNSASTVVVEYRGLTVAEVTELRRQLRAESIDFKVYKNSMVSRAAEAANLGELNETLVGPNAFAFGNDAVAPARILAKFAKTHNALVIKSGVIEGKVFNAEAVNKFATLPNKEGLISMFLGCLQSPVIKFACAVKAVAEAKEGSNEE